LIPSGKITEALDSKVTLWPGHGLPLDATMNQTVEDEYMFASEYDSYLMDPSDFNLRVMLPRTTRLFESFKKLPPLRTLQGAAWVSALTDPEIRQTFQTLLSLADEHKRWHTAHEEITKIVRSRGYPSFRGTGFMAGAPFDHFADLLRGTRGISVDLRRQPQKLHPPSPMETPRSTKRSMRSWATKTARPKLKFSVRYFSRSPHLGLLP
jgi:hypothetical protein